MHLVGPSVALQMSFSSTPLAYIPFDVSSICKTPKPGGGFDNESTGLALLDGYLFD